MAPVSGYLKGDVASRTWMAGIVSEAGILDMRERYSGREHA